ncbi:hypothetical protein D3C75_1355760 [compost metagenome]
MFTLVSGSIGCAEQSEIVALRAAAGEHPFLRRTAQKARDNVARSIYNPFGRPSELVHTGRIAVFIR